MVPADTAQSGGKLTRAHRVKIPDNEWGICGDLWLEKNIWTEAQAQELEEVLQGILASFCQMQGKGESHV